MLRKLTVVAIFFCATSLFAQESNLQPQWWFGGALGLNENFYSGSIANGVEVIPPGGGMMFQTYTFTKGSGPGLYLAPVLEYHPDPVWGGMLRVGFDSRRGSWDDISTPGGGTASLSTSMNYISIEPALRMAVGASPFYLYAGPSLSFNVAKSSTFTATGLNEVDQDVPNTRGTLIGGQVGAGYDFSLSDPNAQTQTKLGPFASVNFGQGPNSVADWSLTTVRVGVELKFGTSTEEKKEAEREVQFELKAPKIIPGERRVKETFPMRNDVFFDEGSTSIPSRYVLLTPDQAKDFSEEKLVQPEPQDLAGRSLRQLKVYHNILNVIGDRLRKHPNASVELSGASLQGIEDAKALAGAVRTYLVGVFGVKENQITIAGALHPEHPSSQPGGTRDLDLVHAEDRRVDFSSADLDLLRPIQIISLQEDPLDNDVIVDVGNAHELLASWSVQVTGKKTGVQSFGPFTTEEERISGKKLLGTADEDDFTLVMTGQTKAGPAVTKEQSFRLAKAGESGDTLGLRFSTLFEFDESKTVATYENFLKNTVAPLIPNGGSVIIHGHTDIIGEESHNLKLSQDRAHETQSVLQRALAAEGKTNVRFDAYGFGSDVRRAPFENKLPEERFYNRTVVIDIIPQ